MLVLARSLFLGTKVGFYLTHLGTAWMEPLIEAIFLNLMMVLVMRHNLIGQHAPLTI